MKLTVGMAAYRDFDQVWFTVQSLRLFHDLTDTEILVVDNFGDDRLKRFVEQWTNGTARYVRYTDVQGTAPAKGRVFAEARGEWVICIDSHVLLWPEALERFRAWAATHPDSRDLLHGPLWYDHLQGGCDALHGGFGGDGVWGTWRAGSPALDAEPYEIEKQGMGLFGCRRDAWLGFAPGMRGFGGEEGALHEKYRRAGRKALSLPFLRWVHLFRDGTAPYPLHLEDKARNYLLAFRDAGLDPAPVLAHFGEVARRIDKELGRDLYTDAASTPSDISEHVPTLAALAAGKRVAEFGVRTGVSTAGFIHGRPASLVSYDLNPCPREAEIRAYAAAAGVPWTFAVGDSTRVEAPEVDVVFIDTLHTAAQLRAELAHLAPRARERIVLHDTETFGTIGEDGGPGLRAAVVDLLGAGWTVEAHYPNNHGLTVLRRAA